MPRSKWTALSSTAILLAALIAGLLHFAELGESSYPEMSSLNAGPKGAKLLFDTLSRMPPIAVQRNYLPSNSWHPSSTTILLLGVQPSRLNLAEKDDLVEIEQLARNNNRIVLAVHDNNLIGKSKSTKPALLKTRWGIQIVRSETSKDADPDLSLNYDSSWQPVAGLDDAVEKRFANRGTVVIALHSGDFSNESLATDDTVLDEIAPLLGPNLSIAFDETHLGIEESGSVAALARRFKLQGLIAGLLILVALFIWNQSVSFPPASQFATERESEVVGADARSMFAGLIVRHLTPQTLLESCIAEWNRLKPQQRITVELPRKTDPVAAYRQLQETLRTRRSRI